MRDSLLQKQADYIRTQVRMPPDLHEAASQYAKENGMSLNAVINLFVESGLNPKSNNPIQDITTLSDEIATKVVDLLNKKAP
ncbi:toxin-antitoxin system HicB family antitoxin [Acinetobacter sp. NIPH 298]|uniref:toxin-antitoxin system HicB family antitoxin n=1 Tax=Acinetobacter sp. NIPH 298 TaxID=1217692 RepID=UPI001486A927|nr:toxin-antitoxin system HicB family antitoxin [Acinetobacter sp. NIPH 298]